MQKHSHPDNNPPSSPLQEVQSTPGLNTSWRCFEEDKTEKNKA